MGMSIIGSICLFPNGGLAYIDALFFAAGASTQSGLNTVNINQLNTWQQFVLYVIAMMCNPMTINTFVVFLRLYWFEKRFRHIVREAKRNRRSISKSRSQIKEEMDTEKGKGINGRSILVMHDTTRPNGMHNDGTVTEGQDEHSDMSTVKPEKGLSSVEDNTKGSNSGPGGKEQADSADATPQPQIKFADQVKRSDISDEPLRLPIQRIQQDHIAFLERQRNPGDTAVLRIPSPRDADAGMAPHAVESDVQQTISRRASTYDSRRGSIYLEGVTNAETHAKQNDPEARRNITIAEPNWPALEHMADNAGAARNTFSPFKLLHRSRVARGEKLHNKNDQLTTSHSRARSNTFQSIRSALSMDGEEGMPYLSWKPTIGRNSAFVDLTEEQKEELGGIEYRSLKSLALILVLYFWGFSIFGVVCLVPWIYKSHTYSRVVTGDGQGRAWWGIFTANSAFTDLGFTLTPDSMISFNTAIWPLSLMTFLVIIGNTGFPIMLRIIIWVTSKYVPRRSGLWEELQFLLHHPRRCFTLLFPAKATWWLFWILVILNGLDLIFFIVLDVGRL